MRLRTYEAVLGSLLLLFTLAAIARADDAKADPQLVPTIVNENVDGVLIHATSPDLSALVHQVSATTADIPKLQFVEVSPGDLYMPKCTVDSHGKADVKDSAACLKNFIRSICDGWKYMANCEVGLRALLDEIYRKPKPEPIQD